MEKTLVIVTHTKEKNKQTYAVITFQSAFGDQRKKKNLPKRNFIV